jgi:hypothetical protein
LAFTKAVAATTHSGPMMASSMITAFMPVNEFRPIRQPWRIAP